MADMAEAIRSLAQQQIDGKYPAAIMFGTITATSPVTLQIDNKIYGSDFVVIPEHLTNYTVTASISGGSVSGNTDNSTVTLDGGEHDGHSEGDGTHTHSGGNHKHGISSIGITNCTLAINNGLKANDKVIVLRQNGGQKFVILDRIGG